MVQVPESPTTAAGRFRQVMPDGAGTLAERPIAIEMPVAIEVDGLAYAVLMATPASLVDLAYGFAHADRLIDGAAGIIEAEGHAVAGGRLLRIVLAPGCSGRVRERIRHRLSESACGLCGVENLEQALRPLPVVAARSGAGEAAIFAALAALRARQPLNAETGAVHAAALCAADGTIRLVREDVGRHNAFDKLIGAMLRGGLRWNGGFALLSSRCSYELVEKAALAGCPLLVTISAATTLAVERARAAGLRLATLARADSYLELA